MSNSLTPTVVEGFDPWSNGGPNPVADNKDGNGSNPYKDWNRQMSQMEEEAQPEPYDDETGVSQPSPRDRIEPSKSSQVFDAAYKSSIVIKQEPHGISVVAYNPIGEVAGGGLLSFSYGPEDYSKAVQMSNHLKSKYKAYKVVDLVNPSPVSENLTEQGDPSKITDSLKKEIYLPLIDAGFQYHNYGDGKIDYVEYYLNGYATIQCAVNYERGYVHVEKFFDSERYDYKNFVKKIPIPSENHDQFANKIVSVCVLLKNGTKGDEAIEGGNHDELDENTPEPATGQPPLNDEDPMYVKYVGLRRGEPMFTMGNEGHKFQYVNAKYPDGKVDIGVYSQRGDMVYSYNAFRKMFNLNETHHKTAAVVK